MGKTVQKNSLAMKFLNKTRQLFILVAVNFVRSSPIVLSNGENSGEIKNLELSGDFSSDNGLFPDTYQDDYGEIQPRIFIEDEFIGKEVLTSGRVELDENDEPYSKVTVVSVENDSGEEKNWFDGFIKKLSDSIANLIEPTIFNWVV